MRIYVPVTPQVAPLLLLRFSESRDYPVYGKGHKARDYAQAAAAKAARAAAREALPSAPSKVARLTPCDILQSRALYITPPQLRLSLRQRSTSTPPRPRQSRTRVLPSDPVPAVTPQVLRVDNSLGSVPCSASPVVFLVSQYESSFSNRG